jgi:hypothetical protein
VECVEKTGFRNFGFSRPGEIAAWASQRRLPEKKSHRGGSKEGGWMYTIPKPGAKVEIPAEVFQEPKEPQDA